MVCFTLVRQALENTTRARGAAWLAHWTVNPEVAGSNPVEPAISITYVPPRTRSKILMSRPPVTLQGDAAGSGGSWIDAAVDQHATVVALGALCADVAEIEIAPHLIHRTVERIAVAGAAGQANLEDLIRRRERHERADAIVVNDPARRVEHHT